MNTTPQIQIGARLRLVQDPTAEVQITNNNGGNTNLPTIQQRCTFPQDPFVNEAFVAPQAGFYRFNTAAEIAAAGMLDVQIEDTDNDAATYFGRGISTGGSTTAQLCVTLYLEAGQQIRRLLAYYADSPTNLFTRVGSNFFEAEYLGL